MADKITKLDIKSLRRPGKALTYNIGYDVVDDKGLELITIFNIGDMPGKTYDLIYYSMYEEQWGAGYTIYAYDDEVKGNPDFYSFDDKIEEEAKAKYPNAFIKKLDQMIIKCVSQNKRIENNIRFTLLENGIKMESSAPNTSETDVCILEFGE